MEIETPSTSETVDDKENFFIGKFEALQPEGSAEVDFEDVGEYFIDTPLRCRFGDCDFASSMKITQIVYSSESDKRKKKQEAAGKETHR